MPRSKVETTYTKAKPKRRGRPKRDEALIPAAKRTATEQTDIQEFLNGHNGEKPWLKLIADYQAECDHEIWPQKILATSGASSENRYDVIQCTGCWYVRRYPERFNR